MFELKQKDIKAIYAWCETYGEDWDGYDLVGRSINEDPVIGVFMDSWGNPTRVSLVDYHDQLYLVITVYGRVKAIKPIFAQTVDKGEV